MTSSLQAELDRFEQLLMASDEKAALELGRRLYDQGHLMDLFRRCLMVTGQEVDYQYFSFDHGSLVMESLIGASQLYCKPFPWPTVHFAIRYVCHLRKIPWEFSTEDEVHLAGPVMEVPPVVDEAMVQNVYWLLQKGLPMRAFTQLAPMRNQKRSLFEVFFWIAAREGSQLAHNLIFASSWWRLWDVVDGVQQIRLLLELLTYFGLSTRITDIQETLTRGTTGRGVYQYQTVPVEGGGPGSLREAMQRLPLEQTLWLYDQGRFTDEQVWSDLWVHSFEKPLSLAHGPIIIRSGELLWRLTQGSPLVDRVQMVRNIVAEFYRSPWGRPQEKVYTLAEMDEMTREGRGKLTKSRYTARDILELETPQATLAAIERWIEGAGSADELFREAMEAYCYHCEPHAINVEYASHSMWNGVRAVGDQYLKYALFRSISLGQEFLERPAKPRPADAEANLPPQGRFNLVIEGGRHTRSFSLPRGDRVFEAARPLLRWLDRTACGGKAECGRCRVIVAEGLENLESPGKAEKMIIERRGFGPNERLACQARACGDLRVLVD